MTANHQRHLQVNKFLTVSSVSLIGVFFNAAPLRISASNWDRPSTAGAANLILLLVVGGSGGGGGGGGGATGFEIVVKAITKFKCFYSIQLSLSIWESRI